MCTKIIISFFTLSAFLLVEKLFTQLVVNINMDCKQQGYNVAAETSAALKIQVLPIKYANALIGTIFFNLTYWVAFIANKFSPVVQANTITTKNQTQNL